MCHTKSSQLAGSSREYCGHQDVPGKSDSALNSVYFLENIHPQELWHQKDQPSTRQKNSSAPRRAHCHRQVPRHGSTSEKEGHEYLPRLTLAKGRLLKQHQHLFEPLSGLPRIPQTLTQPIHKITNIGSCKVATSRRLALCRNAPSSPALAPPHHLSRYLTTNSVPLSEIVRALRKLQEMVRLS